LKEENNLTRRGGTVPVLKNCSRSTETISAKGILGGGKTNIYRKNQVASGTGGERKRRGPQSLGGGDDAHPLHELGKDKKGAAMKKRVLQ